MGEIIDKCQSKCCTYCKNDEKEYKELIRDLSKLHKQKSTDPETLFRSSKNNFFGNYRDILFMQNKLFTIASKYKLPWTEKYSKNNL